MKEQLKKALFDLWLNDIISENEFIDMAKRADKGLELPKIERMPTEKEKWAKINMNDICRIKLTSEGLRNLPEYMMIKVKEGGFLEIPIHEAFWRFGKDMDDERSIPVENDIFIKRDKID